MTGISPIRAGWLVNGIGPATDVASVADPLLRDLIACGLARPDEVRLGLDADASGAIVDASGNPSDRLFTLGRRCAAASTRRRPFPRSATRPRRWPGG